MTLVNFSHFTRTVMLLAISYSLNLPAANPDWFNCSQYYQMSERVDELACDSSVNEYLMSFGHKFCLRFMSAGILVENEIGKLGSSLYSQPQQGQKTLKKLQRYSAFRNWIWGTMECLQVEMGRHISESNDLTCSEIKKIGFKSHRSCYEQNGFCSIPTFWDDIAIKIIGYKNMMSILSDSTDMAGICVNSSRLNDPD